MIVNSAYNVGYPQLRRLQEEFAHAARILQQGEERWRDIYTANDFFYRHSNFLQVSIRASNAADFLTWQRFGESRLRLLITALEAPLVKCWPFARFFGQRFTKFGKICSSERQTSDDSCAQESNFFIALRFAPGLDTVDLRGYVSDFLHKMNTWEGRNKGMDLGICHVLQNDLPRYVFDFKSSDKKITYAHPKTKTRGNKKKKVRQPPNGQKQQQQQQQQARQQDDLSNSTSAGAQLSDQNSKVTFEI